MYRLVLQIITMTTNFKGVNKMANTKRWFENWDEAAVEFYWYAKENFNRDNVSVSGTLLKNITKNTMNGIVDLSNGKVYRFTVKRQENSKLIVFSQKRIN